MGAEAALKDLRTSNAAALKNDVSSIDDGSLCWASEFTIFCNHSLSVSLCWLAGELRIVLLWKPLRLPLLVPALLACRSCHGAMEAQCSQFVGENES